MVESRHKEIITMLEEIRVKLMTRTIERRKFCSKWKQPYGHLIKKRLDKIKSEALYWHVAWNGDKGCEVKKGFLKYTVNLNKKIYSCRGWQIFGIPCAHACYAIWHDRGDLDKFLLPWFSPEMFMKAYEFSLQPINGSHEWKKCGLKPLLPPIPRKTPRRPKRNRSKFKDERLFFIFKPNYPCLSMTLSYIYKYIYLMSK
ncbi:hypothetical protein PTKIN_Ptkin11bG0200400 [Pterospermum kingtungense]